MSKKDEPQDDKKYYVLMFDLAEKINLLSDLDFIIPEDIRKISCQIRHDIDVMIHSYFRSTPEHPISTFNRTMSDVAKELVDRVQQEEQLMKDAMIVSTCHEISDLKEHASLQINRIFNFSGRKYLGMGPRPGQPYLEDQLERIRKLSDGREIILVEDGTFTGKTMIGSVKLLKQYGLKVRAMVIGYVFSKARRNLEKEFSGQIIVVYSFLNYIDWMPDHDFFPFVPNCGRVLGEKWNGRTLPYHNHDGMSFAVPYLAPFCPPELWQKWTHIPAEHCLDMSRYCLDKSISIFRAIEEANETKLTVGAISRLASKVNIPVILGNNRIPNSKDRIIDYLEYCLNLIK